VTRDDKVDQSVSQPLFFEEAPCLDLAMSPALFERSVAPECFNDCRQTQA
jgi:hypothetical protein